MKIACYVLLYVIALLIAIYTSHPISRGLVTFLAIYWIVIMGLFLLFRITYLVILIGVLLLFSQLLSVLIIMWSPFTCVDVRVLITPCVISSAYVFLCMMIALHGSESEETE